MAINSIWWRDNEAYDIHLLRGGPPSNSLRENLKVAELIGNRVDVWNAADAKPAGSGVTGIEFRPEFAGAPSAHGLTVDTATGIVWAAPITPVGPAIRNFLIRPVVLYTSDAGPVKEFTLDDVMIRIHIHDDIERLWLTPSPLTIRVGADGTRFTVLARFTDGSMGDITDWEGLWYEPLHSGVEVSVDPNTGALSARESNAESLIKVTLHLTSGALLTSTARVKTRPAWSQSKQVSWVGGGGPSLWRDTTNVLFLSEGFTSAQKETFDRIVRSIVDYICKEKTTCPLNILKDSMNYWMAFVPSGDEEEPGLSCVSELYSREKLRPEDELFGSQLPTPVKPREQDWEMEHIIHEVGLPVNADIPPNVDLVFGVDYERHYTQKLREWQALYGNKIDSDHISLKKYAQWVVMGRRVLPNERDTAFGLRIGKRPSVSRTVGKALSITMNPRRTLHLQDFLKGLKLGVEEIGAVWAPGRVDNALVCFICWTDRSGGTRTTNFFAVSPGVKSYSNLQHAPSGKEGMDLKPPDIDGETATLIGTSTFGHELGHALAEFHYWKLAGSPNVDHLGGGYKGLGDEYEEWAGEFPESDAAQVSGSGNLQPKSELVKVVNGNGGKKLEVEKIKWRWPRIEKAGVLLQPPAPTEDERIFLISLRKGHGKHFRERDFARLRNRSLERQNSLRGKNAFVVESVRGDMIRIKQVDDPFINPIDYPKESVLIVPKLLNKARELSLISPAIIEFLADPKNNANPLCSGGDTDIPIMTPRIPKRLQMKKKALNPYIIGLYEGGGYYRFGIYRPAGGCMMRSDVDSPTGTPEPSVYRIQRFCHVCRYIIVNRIDPSKHWELDQIYDQEYPQP